MSRSLNKVTLIGNLGADPEIRTTSNGGKVAQFSLATSRQWNSTAGEKQEKTEWHKCVAWNAGARGTGLADIIERYVKKGDKLYVEGRIEYRQYEDKDKQTRYVTEINVREILLLGGGRGGEGGFDAAPRAARPAGGKAPAGGGDGFEEFPAAMEGDDDLPF
ncbi:MAG: single-stranded DNA-binding protein [Gemmatimonadaceae bacterium]|nr:single-stranded DNA-binding protein [Gemmatimonadaceae bacterium]